MTIEEQTKLINDLIHENADATIKDFMSVMSEIEAVRRTAPRRQTVPTVEQVIEAANRILAEKPKPVYKATQKERKYYHTFRFRY